MLEIPDDVVDALQLPPQQQALRLRLELAVALYTQHVLSFGKARELSGLNYFEFGHALGQRNIPRHYSLSDLKDDLSYGGSQ